MKLAIMQPYLFPYIGYFQLINAVDKFISYDDVNFIKQGWINRNRLLIAGNIGYITVPLKNASSFTPINQVLPNNIPVNHWQTKWIKTIRQSYSKAPHFNDVFSLIESVIKTQSDIPISELAINSIKTVCNYLDIKTHLVDTSSSYKNNHLRAEQRVLDICERESCQKYINLIGGVDLYSKENFLARNIELQFLKPSELNYKQFNYPFAPWLSIIDVLMHNHKNQVQQFLNEYQLI